MTTSAISCQALYELIQRGAKVDLVDVRSPAEFRDIHVGIARNVPLDRLDAGAFAAERSGSQQPLYVICHSGARGRQACQKLAALGCANVVNVDGGTQAWERAGLPVVRGKNTMSLERQVRIAAGSLVLTSVILAALVHPYFVALAAFVGAGLIFAGVTDTCGMGLLLARMPWNQAPDAAATCGTKAPMAGENQEVRS